MRGTRPRRPAPATARPRRAGCGRRRPRPGECRRSAADPRPGGRRSGQRYPLMSCLAVGRFATAPRLAHGTAIPSRGGARSSACRPGSTGGRHDCPRNRWKTLLTGRLRRASRSMESRRSPVCPKTGQIPQVLESTEKTGSQAPRKGFLWKNPPNRQRRAAGGSGLCRKSSAAEAARRPGAR